MATFDVEHSILGTTNEHPRSVNSGKITSALHVFYLNLNLLAQNSANCSDTGIQLRMHALFRRHKWSQESGVRHQKWPRLYFCRYRNSIQVIYFQISAENERSKFKFKTDLIINWIQTPSKPFRARLGAKKSKSKSDYKI